MDHTIPILCKNSVLCVERNWTLTHKSAVRQTEISIEKYPVACLHKLLDFISFVVFSLVSSNFYFFSRNGAYTGTYITGFSCINYVLICIISLSLKLLVKLWYISKGSHSGCTQIQNVHAIRANVCPIQKCKYSHDNIFAKDTLYIQQHTCEIYR